MGVGGRMAREKPGKGTTSADVTASAAPWEAVNESHPEFTPLQDKGASPHTPTPVGFWGQATQGT